MKSQRGSNVLLLVIDSLRAAAANGAAGDLPRTPVLEDLAAKTITFRRAYAAECWTLPSHCSMFTGLLPSEHGAHFQTMGYSKAAPTVAELLQQAGCDTELVTRNFVFDGTMPGITRGFQHNTRLLSSFGAWHPFALLLALTKPRNRRILRSAGFFHPLQRDSCEFLNTFARTLMPADHLSFDYILQRMRHFRRAGTRYFLCCNLYDVHWPYPPTAQSVLQPWGSLGGNAENLFFLPFVLPRITAHGYLRPGFRLSDRSRQLLLARYHRAIELMDEKLGVFYEEAVSGGLLDDTLLIVTSDHGEAFGEHGLYLHDASVYNMHLHVPLWIHHPNRTPEIVDDVVSTRDLFGLIRAIGFDEGLGNTILDSNYRAVHPVVLAEHFYYPYVKDMLPRYRQNIAAAVTRIQKIIMRCEGVEQFSLANDPGETRPQATSIGEFETACRRDGTCAAAVSAAMEHLRHWDAIQGQAATA